MKRIFSAIVIMLTLSCVLTLSSCFMGNGGSTATTTNPTDEPSQDHKHSYTATVIDVTCTESGYTVFACSCGTNYKANYIDPTGHTYNSEVTLPTCTEQGYTTYTCDCGDSYVDDYKESTGHTLSGWIVDEKSNCQKAGLKHIECLTCKTTIETELINLSGHNYQLDEKVDATCTDDGYIHYVCVTDGCNSDKTQILTQTGHAFNDEGACLECGYILPVHDHSYAKTVVEATCTSMGYSEYSCACGYSYRTDYIDYLPHTWDEGTITTVDTCTSNGIKSYSCGECGATYDEIIPMGHIWSETIIKEATCTEDGYTSRKCLRCDAEEVKVVIPASHQWEYLKTDIEVTCIEDGSETYICTRCESTQTVVVKKLGHSFYNGKCTVCDAGITDAIKNHPDSSINGMFFGLDETISAYGPAKVNEYGVYLDFNEDANINKVGIYLTQDGTMWRRTIAFTGTNIKYGTYVPYLSYNEDIMYSGLTSRYINTFKLTRDSNGIWNYSNYSTIGANLANKNGELLLSLHSIYQAGANTRIFDDLDEMIAWLKEHDHEDGGTVNVEATCEKDAYTAKICAICGAHYDKILVGESLGHDWSEATCTKLSTCSRCYKTEGELADHIFGKWTVVENSEESERIYQERYCDNCEETETRYFDIVEEEGASKGLEYLLNEDGQSFSVIGIGSCTDTNIIIPETYCELPVTDIAEDAFWNDSFESVIISDSVKHIGDYAFGDNYMLENILISSSVLSIGEEVFAWCNSLTSIEVDENNEYFKSVDGILYSKDGKTLIQYPIGKTDESFVVPDTVTTIAAKSFSFCTSLVSIEIPDSVTKIGSHAFYDCAKLANFKIPESLTKIEDGAFRQTAISEIVIPNSVTSIGELAFESCPLEKITISSSVTSIESSAFSWCYLLTSVVIPKSVTSIGSYAFEYCKSLTSVEISDTVTSIGDGAFRYCYSLASIEIPDSVVNIGDGVFYDCTSLTSIGVDEDSAYYKSIDGNLYSKDGKTLIQYAIAKEASSFTIPDSVTAIGIYAFYNCESITTLVMPNSITSIGNFAFCNCKSLTSVVIGNSVTSIGKYAFSGCTSLKDVYYTGDVEGWLGISFSAVDSTPMYYATNLYFNGELVTSVTIPDSVTSIGDYAFRRCTSLTSIEIPDSVTSIGDEAFWYCRSLTSVTIPDSVKSIGDDAFAYCTSLASIEIPDSVTSINSHAFYYCDSLTSIEIPDSVTNIGNYAFGNCTSLTSIVISDSVTYIGGSAFYKCTSLTIYCEAESQPSGWSSYWNHYNRPVVWGYTGE